MHVTHPSSDPEVLTPGPLGVIRALPHPTPFAPLSRFHRRYNLDPARPMSNSPDLSDVSFPSGEPAVIRRLPAGVEYTHVKQIIFGLSGPLDVLPWFTRLENDALGWSSFRRKSFRALDRVLCREEQRLLETPPQEHGREHQLVAMLRSQFVQHFRLALQLCGVPGKTRWVSTSFVSPSSGVSSESAPNMAHRDLVIKAWEATDDGACLLEHIVVPPGPPPWGDIRVAYYDPWLVDRLLAALFRRHFREVMRRRVGQGWWAERAPTGWPMLTQYAIPMLYDYLRPYYRVRGYTRGLRARSPGNYPRQLLRDITEILHVEVPHLAAGLEEAWVQAAVQRYLKEAPSHRPMGFDMFGIRLDTETA